MPTVSMLERTQVSNGAEPDIDVTRPFVARVSIVGVTPLLFHSWNIEAVDEKGKAAKNSAAKKTDNVESYAYRDDEGHIAVPGVNFHACLIEAGRYVQDPRSSRKSARDLLKAAIVPLTLFAPFEPHRETWDYLDRRRVTVQRAGITRTRPAMEKGWRLTFELLVNTPEYVNVELLASLVTNAGRLVGLCDFRPTYGRFAMAGIELADLMGP